MELRKPLASLAVASLCLTGLGAGAGAAVAAEAPAGPPSYVPFSAFKPATTPEQQHQVYNDWHLDPDHRAGAEAARNGISLAAGADALALKGNGLDAPDAVSASTHDIRDLAESLDLVASDTDGLTFQVPVFYTKDGVVNGGFTTLRKAVGSNADEWTTSAAIPGSSFEANATATLEALTAALEAHENARPIAAGFLSQGATTSVLVSSFTADGKETRFSAQPQTAPAGASTSEYLSAGHIRPDETEYVGWHDGAASGTHETIAGAEAGETLGLRVPGRAQILNGFAEDDFQQNAAAKAADMRIDATGEVWAQVPVFAYPQGVAKRVFTTLRAAVPAGGRMGDATVWSSSKDIPGPGGTVAVAANTETTLAALVAALGDHEVIGYGAFVNEGQVATIRSIAFDNAKTEFAKKFEKTTSKLRVSGVAQPKNGAEQHEVYNSWHFDPDHKGAATQALDGMEIAAGAGQGAAGSVLALKGLGLDAAGTVSRDQHDIRDLALSLDLDASSTEGLHYQVPVFYDKGGVVNGGFTTLRKDVGAAGDVWTTSAAIPGSEFGQNDSGTLEALTAALEQHPNARPIAAGFLAYETAAKTVVKSFTAAGSTTSFAAEPAATAVSFSLKSSYNTASPAAVTVSAQGGVVPTGTVSVTIAGKTFSKKLANGKATVPLSGLIKAGTYSTRVAYTSDNPLAFQSSAKVQNVTITKVSPKVSVKLAKSKVTTRQKAKVSVAVTIPGTLKAGASKFKVEVFDGRKRIKTATLNGSGKATVTLPKLKRGKHKLVVKVGGTANTHAKSSSTLKLTVKKR